MTITLALDTATDLGSVAVHVDGRTTVEVSLAGRRHAAELVSAVETALALASSAITQVDHIVLADGPGSFTGLRIGAATVQGIVRAHESVRVRVVPSLLGAAWVGAQLVSGPVAALYDALRGEVYAAVYRFHPDRVEILLPPGLGSVTELAGRVEAPAVAVGDGALVYAEAVRRWTGRDPVGPPVGAPRASALLAAAQLPGAARELEHVATFAPDYGRPAEAQVRWERQHGRPLPDSPGHFS